MLTDSTFGATAAEALPRFFQGCNVPGDGKCLIQLSTLLSSMSGPVVLFKMLDEPLPGRKRFVTPDHETMYMGLVDASD